MTQCTLISLSRCPRRQAAVLRKPFAGVRSRRVRRPHGLPLPAAWRFDPLAAERNDSSVSFSYMFAQNWRRGPVVDPQSQLPRKPGTNFRPTPSRERPFRSEIPTTSTKELIPRSGPGDAPHVAHIFGRPKLANIRQHLANHGRPPPDTWPNSDDVFANIVERPPKFDQRWPNSRPTRRKSDEISPKRPNSLQTCRFQCTTSGTIGRSPRIYQILLNF